MELNTKFAKIILYLHQLNNVKPKNTPPKGILIAIGILVAVIICYFVLMAIFPDLFYSISTGRAIPVKIKISNKLLS